MPASAARPIDDAETDERVNALLVIPPLHRTRLRQPDNPELVGGNVARRIGSER